MISWAYILGAQRARTRWPGAPRAGMERRQVGAGPLSSNLLSQVTDPPKIVKADFTMLSENPRAGRESLTNLPPHGKFWPSHHSPARPPRLSPSLAPILEVLYIYDACGIWKTTDKATQGHLSNHLEGRPKLSKVSCLANNLLLLGVEHFFKEWVCWLLPEEEGRLILSYKYPLQIYAYWKISDDQSYNQIFFNMIWSE